MDMDELCVLCLGYGIPDARVRQKLQNNFKCPVGFDDVTSVYSALASDSKKYNIILARDNSMGMRALESAPAAFPDIPIILLMETYDDSRALELVKKGAADCIVMDAIDKLSFVICKEVEKSKQTASPGPNVKGLTAELIFYRMVNCICLNFQKFKDLHLVYEDILETAIALTHADKGFLNIYVEKENCLKLVAQCGFHASSKKRIDIIRSESFISGQALAKRQRCIIEDTDTAAAFCSDDELQLIHDEQLRCLQSTPIISSSGIVYGILNTYYCSKHSFNELELSILDILANRASVFIDIKRYEIAHELGEAKAAHLVQKLKTANRRKNEFLYKLSHELRNPLASITAAISLLEITDEGGETKIAREIIKCEVKQLCHLIDELLEVTRIANNRAYINKTFINLSQAVYDSVNSFRLQFEKKAIQLMTKIPDKPVILSADPVKIKQIICNLLSNALSYTDEGGNVILSLSEDEGCAVLCVNDNGIGISAQDLPYLFHDFFQPVKPDGRANAGLGLGLTIVKGMAELHGGTVTAYSQGIGFGSTFTVRLPIIDVPSSVEV